MDITTITRKITGNNYDNISLSASIKVGEDVNKCCVELDEMCGKALVSIEEKKQFNGERSRKEGAMLNKVEALRTAIQKHEIDDLPF